MNKITITDLEVSYFVGVPDEERAKAQRLLLTVEMTYDFAAAAAADEIEKTIDYFKVSQALLKFGDGKSWKLIEKLGVEIAEMILEDYGADAVIVEVKKFPIPQSSYVSVTVARSRGRE